MQLRHAAFNLVGMGAPLLAAVVAIPMLIGALGDARFGLLALVWAVVSYFGVFDLGLGRALTQQIAVLDAKAASADARSLLTTATVALALLGVLAALALLVLSYWGVGRLAQVPDEREAMGAAWAMAAAMPAIVITSGLRGALEARRAFGAINAIRLPMGLFTFLGPLAVVLVAPPRLDTIAWVLAAGRIVACAVHAVVVLRLFSPHGETWIWDRRWIRPLLVTGGWLSASNVISPLLGYLDRFLIGGAVSAAAVAYYAVPHELITKLWIVPAALTSVLFPSFASEFAHDPKASQRMLHKAVLWVGAVMVPVCLVLVAFAEPILRHWIGADFARQSHLVLQILGVGMLASAAASVPYTAIQGAGHARVTAMIHMAELPIFGVLIVALTLGFGVVGAACAWTLRAFIDAALMFHFQRRTAHGAPA